ncbi:ATP-dependent DNA helicase II subunit 2 [Agyrium rufum]|nr:ATP-dependent DNA helicase II subunit 2 [Agyrium rufum]
MADKEATIFIIDVGASMGETHGGRTQSDFDWAMTYVWDKITSIVATERKTLNVGVVVLRTAGTSNDQQDDDSYAHVSVVHPLGQVQLPELRRLMKVLRVSQTDRGDAISAVVVAIEMISKFCKKLKYKRKIVLVTNGTGSFEPDGLEQIAAKISEDNIELVVLGVDFDDLEYGYKEEDKDEVKAENERTLHTLVDGCNGVIGTLVQAIDELGEPRLKVTRPVPSYKDNFTLGNPEEFESALVIDVERYPRTMLRRPATASNFVQRTDLSNAAGSTQSTGTVVPEGEQEEARDPTGLTHVKYARAYRVKDDEAPGGKRDVPYEDLAKGYEYGRTAVHISESDQLVTKMETEAGMQIIGFIPWANYDRYMSMTASSTVVPQRTNKKAILAMSSLIHALYELESYAIARFVPKKGKEPVLTLLAPSVDVDYECLIDVQLPFAEDFRPHKFPPLDRVLTVSGKVLKEHRNLPNDTLLDAMSDYVDSMDLSKFGRNDEGNPTEYMPIKETYSPVLHRIDQAIRWRAVHPTGEVPPPYEILTRYSKIPAELVENAQTEIQKLIAAADVKKVPPKLAGRKRGRDSIKPISGIDVEKLLAQPGPSSASNGSASTSSHQAQAKPTISPDNAIPTFRQALDRAESVEAIHDAAAQLGRIIEARIRDSFGDQKYARAIEEMGVLRQEMIEMEEPGQWNGFLRGLKGKVLGEDLGGERREVWWGIRRARLGLVTGREAPQSKVTEEEAREFWGTTSKV